MLDSRLAPEILFLCQLEEMLFSSKWDQFFRIYSIIQKYQYRGWKNWDGQKMV